jgi:DNA-binding MarR family transcriptional regulator
MTKTILVLAANPKDTPPLRLDQEVREIEDVLRRAQKRDEFVLQQKWAARPEDVRRAMLDYKPNIVHFCGHGAGADGIAFEDNTGQTQLVNADVLSRFFKLFSNNLECVVLNACFSEAQAEAIARHIPCVIGMKGTIGDNTAIPFAIAFYDALGAGESIEFAYQLAHNATQWTSTPSGMMPVLKTFGLSVLKALYQPKNLLRTKKGISSDTRLDITTVTDQLNILEKNGFVSRIKRSNGERWAITALGKRLVEDTSRESSDLSQ